MNFSIIGLALSMLNESIGRMSIWQSIFGWKTFFRWDVLGAIVPGIFIASGFATLTLDWFPYNVLISQILFVSAATLIVIKIIGHAIEAKDSPLQRALFAVLLSVTVVAVTVFVVVAVQRHKNPTNGNESQNSPTPRLDLSPFFSDGYDIAHALHFHVESVNNGMAPALNVISTSAAEFKPESPKSEDEVFYELEAHENDSDTTISDIAPGTKYRVLEPMWVPVPSASDQLAFQQRQKVLYLGHLESYSDARGKRHYSERCMFGVGGTTLLNYCRGHNRNR